MADDPTPTPTPPPADPAPVDPPALTPDPPKDTDWKAEARKWEKLAKDNKTAATDLEKLRKQHMTEQEKAIADAEEKGRTAASEEYDGKLAAAWETATENAILRVSAGAGADADALLDSNTFLDSLEDFVDDDPQTKGFRDKLAKHIKKFVEEHPKFKTTPAGPARSGGDHPGGGGTPNARPTSLSAAVHKSLSG